MASTAIGYSYRLFQRLHLRGHVGKATHPVGRVAAFQDPDSIVGPRALCISRGAQRLVTGKALRADLRGEYALNRFFRGLGEGRCWYARRTYHDENTEHFAHVVFLLSPGDGRCRAPPTGARQADLTNAGSQAQWEPAHCNLSRARSRAPASFARGPPRPIAPGRS